MKDKTQSRLASFMVAMAVFVSLASANMAIAARSDYQITIDQWLEAVAISGVPSEALYAMSLTESGTTFHGAREFAPWPWVLNVNEEALWFATRESAREHLRAEIDAGNEWVAVGMFQIHLKYNGELVDDNLSLLEPEVNLWAASQVLASCGKEYPTLSARMACYYSGQDDEEGMAYAARVLELSERWGKPYQLDPAEEQLLIEERMKIRQAETKTNEDITTTTDPVMPEFKADVEPNRDERYLAFLTHLKVRESASKNAVEQTQEGAPARAISVGSER